jgi:hypothetical protein
MCWIASTPGDMDGSREVPYDPLNAAFCAAI